LEKLKVNIERAHCVLENTSPDCPTLMCSLAKLLDLSGKNWEKGGKKIRLSSDIFSNGLCHKKMEYHT
jgi:hypothetical protein